LTKRGTEGKLDLECPPVPYERNQIIPHLLSVLPQFSPAFLLAVNTLHRTTHVLHRTRQCLKHVPSAEVRLCRRTLVREYIDQRLDRLQHRLRARTTRHEKAKKIRRDSAIRIERRSVRVLRKCRKRADALDAHGIVRACIAQRDECLHLRFLRCLRHKTSTQIKKFTSQRENEVTRNFSGPDGADAPQHAYRDIPYNCASATLGGVCRVSSAGQGSPHGRPDALADLHICCRSGRSGRKREECIREALEGGYVDRAEGRCRRWVGRRHGEGKLCGLDECQERFEERREERGGVCSGVFVLLRGVVEGHRLVWCLVHGVIVGFVILEGLGLDLLVVHARPEVWVWKRRTDAGEYF
jgi:hypothetical protein